MNNLRELKTFSKTHVIELCLYCTTFSFTKNHDQEKPIFEVKIIRKYNKVSKFKTCQKFPEASETLYRTCLLILLK
jgi:hypothetical protein